jgi:hypothetical protein
MSQRKANFSIMSLFCLDAIFSDFYRTMDDFTIDSIATRAQAQGAHF